MPALLDTPAHRDALMRDAHAQLHFFDRSLRGDGGFDALDHDGTPLPPAPQPLHVTTRMVHSYVLGRAIGHPGSERMIDAGLAFLRDRHRDGRWGGYLWSVGPGGDGTKLAYGHVFVLLAASSARLIGHPDAPALFHEAADIIDRQFWDAEAGLLRDEFTRDWRPFSEYRGMNANMHGVEAMLAAFEATGEARWLDRAGGILAFFTDRMASAHAWRIPEHYRADWTVDPGYAGDPMFRPAGTTPGHSLEFARLILHNWDLAGRPDDGAPDRARMLARRALDDAWLPEGGLAYTLTDEGAVAIPDRYWWPVTEGLGALAALSKLDGTAAWDGWYRRLWTFAQALLIDDDHGGWRPEIGPGGAPASGQFAGKPDIYHSLQAVLYPLAPGLSRPIEGLETLSRD